MKTARLILLTAVFSLPMALSIPLMAQETRETTKYYCPYCGMVNFATNKFCGECGSTLWSIMLPPSTNGNELTAASVSMRTSYIASVNDTNTATKAFDSGKVLRNEDQQGLTARPIAGGILGGGIGLIAGAYLGYGIDNATSHHNYYHETDGLAGAALGAPLGEALGVPLGVHIGNGRRGNLKHSILASMGIAGAGLVWTFASNDYRTPAYSLPLTALAQLVACVAIERATSNSR